MKPEEILAKVYGCKDVEELKKDFAFNTRSVKMIVEAIEEYAAQSTQEGGTVEAIVVWKDGTYKIVESNSLFEYENDKDWLTTINLTEYASQVSATDKKRIEELEAEVQQLTGLSNAAIRMEFELAFKNQELEKEVERLRGLVEDAHLNGFKLSGEGWNGEYPFSDCKVEIKTDETYNAYWEQFKKENYL